MQTGTEDEGEREGRGRSIAGESKEQTQTVVGRGETGGRNEVGGRKELIFVRLCLPGSGDEVETNRHGGV